MRMDKPDREKIERIISTRRWANQKFKESGSRVYRAFLDMESAAYAAGALDKKYKELIALGISVVTNCESCMEWHIHQALEAGAAEDQIRETVEVGIEMGGGPATVASRFALKVLQYYL
jgi:AhpD family alkylhydroperoxidase